MDKPTLDLLTNKQTNVFEINTSIAMSEARLGLHTLLLQHEDKIEEALEKRLLAMGYVKLKPAQRVVSCCAAHCDSHENFSKCGGCMNLGSWNFI